MPKKKPTAPAELTTADKLYIDLCLKTFNNINYEELFTKLAGELSRPVELIHQYANKQSPLLADEQLPPEPKPKELKPEQALVRNLMTPNRLTEPNKAKHVTVMSDVSSEFIEKNPAGPIKGSSRMKDVIFRQ